LNSVISTLENELQEVRKKAEKPRSAMSNRKSHPPSAHNQSKMPISPESNSGAQADDDVKMLFDQNEELRQQLRELESKLYK